MAENSSTAQDKTTPSQPLNIREQHSKQGKSIIFCNIPWTPTYSGS
jgi:hypothetical protein